MAVAPHFKTVTEVFGLEGWVRMTWVSVSSTGIVGNLSCWVVSRTGAAGVYDLGSMQVQE